MILIMNRNKFKYPVTIFCILNVLFPILLGLILSFDYVPFQWFPGISAIVLTILVEGKTGFDILLKRIAIKVKYYKWYFISIIYPVIISFFAFCIVSYYMNGDISFPKLNYSIKQYSLIFLAIIWGSIGEELGWRGFMLPLLSKRHSLFKSSLIIGLFWGIWHMYFFSGVYVFLIYLVLTIEFTLVMAWIQRKIHGNIVASIISHSSFNICAILFFKGILISENSNNLFLIYSAIVVLSTIPCLIIITKHHILEYYLSK